jgi:hypothetical protein
MPVLAGKSVSHKCLEYTKCVRGSGRVAVPRPFLFRTARNRVRKVARAAGLLNYLTMEACRAARPGLAMPK